MATTSVESSPASLAKGSTSNMGSSPMLSPSSDKKFWSALRNRVDSLLESKNCTDQTLPTTTQPLGVGGTDRAKRLKEDSMLLLRGFDSVANSLSQLSNNIENALQGARDLARPPTLTEIVQSTLQKAKSKAEQEHLKEDEDVEEGQEQDKRGLKRKVDSKEDAGEEDSQKEESPKQEMGTLKKAKNLASSMATKAAALARELKSLKSDLIFMQDRCALLEEENRRLRTACSKGGMRPDEDDLVRLQLEALLAEKSRLANENANLKRENQCLHQMVEYHQFTSQDLSASYENLITGMCLDFSSIPEEEDDDRAGYVDDNGSSTPKTPQACSALDFAASVDACCAEEQEGG